jgi:hypothetical protein
MGVWLKSSAVVWVIVSVSLVMAFGCAAGSESIDRTGLTYVLAHNTERRQIIEETSSTLQLHSYVIEYTDFNRDRAALQTFWRPSSASPADAPFIGTLRVRDRAILHIAPRGRSTIHQNVYLMVNASLQFEVEQQDANGRWVAVPPSSTLRALFESIVKDVRNRMLKYHYEL